MRGLNSASNGDFQAGQEFECDQQRAVNPLQQVLHTRFERLQYRRACRRASRRACRMELLRETQSRTGITPATSEKRGPKELSLRAFSLIEVSVIRVKVQRCQCNAGSVAGMVAGMVAGVAGGVNDPAIAVQTFPPSTSISSNALRSARRRASSSA